MLSLSGHLGIYHFGGKKITFLFQEQEDTKSCRILIFFVPGVMAEKLHSFCPVGRASLFPQQVKMQSNSSYKRFKCFIFKWLVMFSWRGASTNRSKGRAEARGQTKDCYLIIIFHINSLKFSQHIVSYSISDYLNWTETSLLCRLQAQTLPDEAPPVGKIHPFSKIAVTFEPIQRFRCPSRFRISEKMSI